MTDDKLPKEIPPEDTGDEEFEDEHTDSGADGMPYEEPD